MDMPQRPLDVLEAAVGEPVMVLLKDGTRYRGMLAGYDQHLNIVLEDALMGPEETPESGESADTGEDTIVIRGDNVVSITP